jgi:hypothetical protein
MRRNLDNERRRAAVDEFLRSVVPDAVPCEDVTQAAEKLITATVKKDFGLKVTRWLFLNIDQQNWNHIEPTAAHELLKAWGNGCGLKDPLISSKLVEELHRLTDFVRTKDYKSYLTDVWPICRRHMEGKELETIKSKYNLHTI